MLWLLVAALAVVATAFLSLDTTAVLLTPVVVLLAAHANAGPLVTPWASLATLLWHARLVRFDVEISWRRYALLGLVAAPLTVGAATLALWAAHGASGG